MNQADRITHLTRSLIHLTEYQLSLIEKLVGQLTSPYSVIRRNESSDLISNCVLSNFGDVLRLHHCFSKQPFTKDKFEYALVNTLSFCGLSSSHAPRGISGHDIVFGKERISLKTQADASIRATKLHISKFMELGKGKWGDDPADLKELLLSYMQHLEKYDRIFSLRCLSKPPLEWEYELIEIPRHLLQHAQHGTLRMILESPQYPKPGYCDVYQGGELIYQLYFDGGGERKLQVKNLQKAHCVVHAVWQFPDVELIKTDS